MKRSEEKGREEKRVGESEPERTMASKEATAAGFINVSREITGKLKTVILKITVKLGTCCS